MRKWKTVTIGCYSVLGRQIDVTASPDKGGRKAPQFYIPMTDDVQSAAITDLDCKDGESAQLIYQMWTARFD